MDIMDKKEAEDNKNVMDPCNEIIQIQKKIKDQGTL